MLRRSKQMHPDCATRHIRKILLLDRLKPTADLQNEKAAPEGGPL